MTLWTVIFKKKGEKSEEEDKRSKTDGHGIKTKYKCKI